MDKEPKIGRRIPRRGVCVFACWVLIMTGILSLLYTGVVGASVGVQMLLAGELMLVSALVAEQLLR